MIFFNQKNVLKIVVLVYTLLSCHLCSAHQPDLSSTLIAEKNNGDWVLQIRAALTAFEYEIHNSYGVDSYKTPQEFEELVIEHISNNFKGVVNQSIDLDLSKGQVKLGHETSVTFNIKPRLVEITQFNIINSTFANIGKNKSALVILKKGNEPQQFVLDSNNKHTVNLKLENDKFIDQNNVSFASLPSTSIPVFIFICLGLIAGLILFYVLIKKTNLIS